MYMGFFNRNRQQAVREIERLEYFEAQRRELREAGKYSVEPRIGHMAIFVSEASSGWGIKDKDLRLEMRQADLESRETKAKALLARGMQTHHSAEILFNPQKQEVFDYLRDRAVASMVFLAPGTVTHAKVNIGEREVLEWDELAERTRHLKTGNIDQFMYGLHPIKGNYYVPMGMFSVARPEDIIVSVNLGGDREAEVQAMDVMPPFRSDNALVPQIVRFSEEN
jgi:hypothetical protein